ncbi:MAG: efflux RND transporter periplasmic adaptor subunit [Treponema sp.]|jgi:HlyD family secretion protein|nr:efflux RND transporter periplasmic adaptor subunit [Treponema sp.]
MKQRNVIFKAAPVILAAILAAELSGCAAAKTANGSRTYEFTTVSRGSLEKTVSSSGSLNPVSTVKVRAQMSGLVEQVYVDYNDQVKAGDILAKLNTDTLQLQRQQQQAQVQKVRANYELQRVNYQNQQQLAEKNLISEYDLKSSKTTLDGLAADLAVAEANLKVIETEISQYAYVTSPINGIVLERNINVGDTVSGNTSSSATAMFTLAENLTEMQIQATVGELDVSSIYKGQAVRFTLESLAGRRFSGTVETLRMVPAVSNSVVNYTVMINVRNQDGSLMPGMTCAVDFIVERGENILTVPNAALRYQPTGLSAEEIAELVFNASLKNMSEEQQKAALDARAQQKAAAASGQTPSASTGGSAAGASNTSLASLVGGGAAGGMMGGGMPGGGQFNAQRGTGGATGGGTAGSTGTRTGSRPAAATVTLKNLWYIADDGKPAVIQVETGITNGTSTEVKLPANATDDLEGMRIILKEKV